MEAEPFDPSNPLLTLISVRDFVPTGLLDRGWVDGFDGMDG